MMVVSIDSEQGMPLKDSSARVEKKPNVGEFRLRFKKLDDVAMDTIADLIREMPVADYIARSGAKRGKQAGPK